MIHFSLVSRLTKFGRFCFVFLFPLLRKQCVNLLFGEMKPAAIFSSNHLLTMVFLLDFVVEISSCDMNWIRLVYMMSCGKKKRESMSTRNETFFENVPQDFAGAVKYFKDNDPDNSMLSNEALLREILEDGRRTLRLKARVPKLTLVDDSNQLTKTPSVLLHKLTSKWDENNHLGIPGFPEQWDIDEIMDEKINENHRREIDRLIELCCKVPPVVTCNGSTFKGACK